MFYRSAPNIILQALLVSAISAGTAHAGEVFVSLKTEAKISQMEVHLGDVADIAAADSKDRRRLELFKIAKLPPIGAFKLSRSEIEYGLNKGIRGSMPTIVWGGAENVLISGKSQRVSLAPGIDAAAVFLLNRLGGNGKVTLRMVHGVENVEVPLGKAVVRPDFPSIQVMGAHVDVPLIVEIGGVKVRQTSVRFQVIPRSEKLAFPKNKLYAKPEASDESLAALESSSRTDGEHRLVAKDQAVTLLIDTGGVRIETAGMALNNANKGEKVRVRRINGGAEIVGRVMQSGVVLADEF